MPPTSVLSRGPEKTRGVEGRHMVFFNSTGEKRSRCSVSLLVSAWCLMPGRVWSPRAARLLRQSSAGRPPSGPAHLHEVPVVLQHAAGRLPGVLVAFPRVHPGRVGEGFLLVPSLSLISHGLPQRPQLRELSRLAVLCT